MPPNQSSASCDFDLWPPAPKIDRFMPLPSGPLVSLGIKIGSFLLKYRLHKLITDGRTDGQPENIMLPPVSLVWRRHKTQNTRKTNHNTNKLSITVLRKRRWKNKRFLEWGMSDRATALILLQNTNFTSNFVISPFLSTDFNHLLLPAKLQLTAKSLDVVSEWVSVVS